MSGAARHVVVTGGGTGVGAETARAFAEAGAEVTIMGRREAPLKAQGLPYEICDVTDAAAVRAAFEAARTKRGPVTVAVANAGAAESEPFARMRAESLEAMLAVNITGVFNTWQAALPDMKAAGWGRMIAVASTAGSRDIPMWRAMWRRNTGLSASPGRWRWSLRRWGSRSMRSAPALSRRRCSNGRSRPSWRKPG